jgi:hypothetical protein
MRYRWFCSPGLFTGSGVAGAGCKSIVGQRLRQAGMHRTTDGAGVGAIIALRCAEASSQWEPICNTRTLRHEPRDQPRPQDDLGYLQKGRAPSG